MRRFIARTLPIVAIVFLSVATAHACPMCSQSIAEENSLPRAYMYSILFMLGMPATLFSGFALTLYFKFRNHYANHAALMEQAAYQCPSNATSVCTS